MINAKIQYKTFNVNIQCKNNLSDQIYDIFESQNILVLIVL